MIVWMHRFLGAGDTAKDLNCSIRNDLVRVHVGRRTRTGLEYIKNEVLVEPSIDHFLSGLYNGGAEFPIQQTKINIRLCSGELDETQSANEFAGKAEIADWKILNSALSLSTVKRVSGDAHRAHGVPFNASGLWLSTGRRHKKNSFRETVCLRPSAFPAESTHTRRESESYPPHRPRDATATQQDKRAWQPRPDVVLYPRCGRHPRMIRHFRAECVARCDRWNRESRKEPWAANHANDTNQFGVIGVICGYSFNNDLLFFRFVSNSSKILLYSSAQLVAFRKPWSSTGYIATDQFSFLNSMSRCTSRTVS